MKTVAVIGSASDIDGSGKLAEELGRQLAKKGFAVITGAGTGLPLKAAASAKKSGAMVIGISPARNAAEHRSIYPKQPEAFDFIAYTGFGKVGRNVLLVRSADAVISVGGRTGTLNEFSIAFEEGKLIGILEGSGGFSDRAREFAALGAGKGTGADIVYSRNPKELVEKVHRLLK